MIAIGSNASLGTNQSNVINALESRALRNPLIGDIIVWLSQMALVS